MGLTQEFKDKILTASAALITTGGVGLDNTPYTSADTGLFGGKEVIDALDATTGWSNSGDAGAATLNTTAGEYQEGTGCLNLPSTFSTGVSSWYKTITSADLTSKKLYLWIYMDDVTDLDTSVTAITVDIGTSGFTNYDTWSYANTEFTNGWNSLYIDCDVADSTSGSGLVLGTSDSIRINFNLISTQTTNDTRMDYIRYYEAGTLGITDSIKTVTKITGTNYFKTTVNLTSTDANGLAIVEAGDSDGSDLLSRQTFAAINKGNSTQVQIDKYYYIE